MERAPVVNSSEQLLSILAVLEDCRAALALSGTKDTAQLVSMAVLDLRMKLNHIDDSELRALCDEIAMLDASIDREHRAAVSQRRRPLLRLVK
jgi:hypothetical protein